MAKTKVGYENDIALRVAMEWVERVGAPENLKRVEEMLKGLGGTWTSHFGPMDEA